MSAPAHDVLPTGFAVELAEDTVACGTTLLGGSSGKVVRLRPRAVALLAEGRLEVRDTASARLARILLDRGLADPCFTGSSDPVDDVTVVVPVRDRPVQLARLLDALPAGLDVVVVDDGSEDPGPTTTVAARRGARVLLHPHQRGPAAARNTGLRAVRTPYVVFVDSDVVPVEGWLEALRRHFDDPAVGAAAPRVRSLSEATGTSWIERYEAARSSLDLGPRPAGVTPHGRVSYVPSATLMARVEAIGDGFEEDLEVAEDVDAIWRLRAQGWRVRYEPRSVVRHDHRTETHAWLARKAFYGTGAGLLAQRHGSAVAPMVLTPWTAGLTVAVLAQRRWSLPAAAACLAGTTLVTAYRLKEADAPLRTAATVTLIGSVSTAHQTFAALTRHYWPLAVPAALASRRARRALVVAAVADGVLDHRRTEPALDLPRYVLARRLDDLAYGAGLWCGAVRARAPRALLPLVRVRRTPPTPDVSRTATQIPPTREGHHHGQERLVRNGR